MSSFADKDIGAYSVRMQLVADGFTITATHRLLPDVVYRTSVSSREPAPLYHFVSSQQFEAVLEEDDRVLSLLGPLEFRLARQQSLAEQVLALRQQVELLAERCERQHEQLTAALEELRNSSSDAVSLAEALATARVEGTTQNSIVLRTGIDYNNATYTNTASPGWMTLSFDNPVMVRAIHCRFYDADNRTYTWTLEVSLDGARWDTIERYARNRIESCSMRECYGH